MVSNSGTVDKAVQVLVELSRSGGVSGLAALAEAVGMPKATVHRLLASLAAHELVEAQAGGRYALGIGLVRLGLGALAVDPFVRVARAELERAAAAFGETFFVVAPRAGKLLVLDKVEGSGVLRAAPTLGSEVPVVNTASGRLVLAHAPGLVRDGDALRATHAAAVERALRDGHDVNEDEWIAGMTVVAAPVYTSARFYGTVACAGVSQLLGGERKRDAIRRTERVARRLSAALAVGGVPGAETRGEGTP